MKLCVLDGYCLNPGDLSWDELRSLCEVDVHDRTPPDLVVSRASGAALLFTNKTPVRREAMARLPELRYIGVLATGYNIVDTDAARERGICVTNIPTYGTMSVAQHAIALILELCIHAGEHSRHARGGGWSSSADWCYWNYPLVELAGKTMGIVGFGRIGRATARIADALGMRIIAHDTRQDNPPGYPGFAWTTLDELLAGADFVSLHCPLTSENLHMIDARRLSRMKTSAFLVNTSRGPLVKDSDLADALNAGHIAGAALDVLSVEPPDANHPLFTARNCIITPHIAWATREARARLMQVAVDNVRAFLAGQPQNLV